MTKNNTKVIFYNDEEEVTNDIPFSNAVEDINRILKYIIENELEEVEKAFLSIHFVSSDRIRELNRDFRSTDKATDVLSFPMMDYDEEWIYLGDIFINKEIVKEQALSIESDEDTEVKFLSMHGMLHLIGYDHITTDDEENMTSKQREIFKNLNIREW